MHYDKTNSNCKLYRNGQWLCGGISKESAMEICYSICTRMDRFTIIICADGAKPVEQVWNNNIAVFDDCD